MYSKAGKKSYAVNVYFNHRTLVENRVKMPDISVEHVSLILNSVDKNPYICV